MSKAMLEGICEYTNLSMADFDAQPPAFSVFATVMIDRACNIYQASITSSESTETPNCTNCTVGPPARKYLVEVAKAVKANNKYLDEERAQKEQAKEQAKKDREAKKQEAAIKKARAEGGQQKARERKAERRKQGKLQLVEKQAKIRGPRRSLQTLLASPVASQVASSKPRKEKVETTEPDTIHDISADAVPLSLEDVVEAIIQGNVPAPCMDGHEGKAASSSKMDKLIHHSESESIAKTCSIDTADDCQCAVCLDYDAAIDKLQGRPSDESPSHPEAAVEILSPEPKTPHSPRAVGRLEDAALALQTDGGCSAKDQASENAYLSQSNSTIKSMEGQNLAMDIAPEHVVASQHHSIGELEERIRLKSSLNVNAPPFVFVPGLPTTQRPIKHTRSTNDFPNWVELGLAAETAEDSLFSRVQQLKVLGALTPEDPKTFGTIISKLWRQMYLATQDNPNILKPMSSPGVSGAWKWSDFQMSAEDREDSIFGLSKNLASLGF